MLKKVTFLNSVFKILLITLFFNMIVILIFLYIILLAFSTANQKNSFKTIYQGIQELKEVDIQSEDFNKIIKTAQNNDCTIEIYDAEIKQKIYPKYPKLDLSGIDLQGLFDEILKESTYYLTNTSGEEKDAFMMLNGQPNQMSMIIQKEEYIYILVQAPLDSYEGYYNIGAKTIIASFLISFLIACSISIVFSNNVFKDISEIKRISEKMAKQDFSEKCVAKSNDELERVAEAMNAMAFSLQKHIQDADRVSGLLRKDLENQRKMEQSQKDFVSNVSHELKTPISIISGYTEGIKYGLAKTEQEIDEYCDTILNECNRMVAIVKRLLTLSKMENDNQIDMEENDISSMINDLIQRYSFKNPDRVFAEEAEDNLKAYCDRVEIERVLINYIDNAIKYSSGEIVIRAYSEQEYVYVGIESFGSYITEEEQEKIWNKFYRIDVSHQREDLSAGLGLSIVKAIMTKHGYPYGVINTKKGVEFYIKLKKLNNNMEPSQKTHKP